MTMMDSNEGVLIQIERIRDFVNEPRKHYWLFQNKPMFFQLSSSMDVIEDTELAIQAYSESVFEDENRKGELYLAIYGLLQAIYVQQDAIKHLIESLGINESIKSYERLVEIRNIRNDSIGHPTKKDFDDKSKKKKGEKRKASYHFITRISLSKNGFDLLSRTIDGSFEHRYISTQELIADQHKYISEILEKIVKKLQHEENEHKAKFSDEKLKDAFSQVSYFGIEQIKKGVNANLDKPDVKHWEINDVNFGLGGLDYVIKLVISFRDSLQRRDEGFAESIKSEIEEFVFAAGRLKEIFSKKLSREIISKEEQLSMSILLKYIETQMKVFEEYAKQLDDEYSE